MAFNVGELVCLKSGGPIMTVYGYQVGTQAIKCQWFAGKKLETGDFPQSSLNVVDAEGNELKKK